MKTITEVKPAEVVDDGTRYAVWDTKLNSWCVMKYGDVPVFQSRFKADEVRKMCNEAHQKDKKLKRPSRRYVTKPLEILEITVE